MVPKKDYEDASLFLNFIRRAREFPDRFNTKRSVSFAACSVDSFSDDKYRCIYCGCEYVYRRSLISHMKKLHKITDAL